MIEKENRPLKEINEEKLLKEIGLRIQAIRRRLNYNQKEFAVSLGISNARRNYSSILSIRKWYARQ